MSYDGIFRVQVHMHMQRADTEKKLRESEKKIENEKKIFVDFVGFSSSQ